MPRITLAHSPDLDDAFMWWALAAGRIDAGEFELEFILDDIESLNEKSLAGACDITAISCAQYPFVAEEYAITSCGGSFGESYGPKLVARRQTTLDDLRRKDSPIAVPGLRTTAALVTAMMLECGKDRLRPVRFDEVGRRISRGEFEAGIVIHEGQLTFAESGLHLVADAGLWWHEQTGLPLPLGLNVIKRDLDARHGAGTTGRVVGLLRASIEYGLNHREAARDAVLHLARDVTKEQADAFIAMYVSRWTVDCGREGREAIEALLAAGHRAGLLPKCARVDVEAGIR
jgi:1,4-dihydroxy-6-naphthoate synthase